jgi:Phasin protein
MADTSSPEFMKVWEEIRDEWLARIKSETDQATQLMEKLRTAGSFPEVMTVYQAWMSRRMERFAEDSRRLWTDSEKLMGASTQMIPQAGSWMSGKRPGISS